MLLGQRLDSLPDVAVAQILGLRVCLASPRAALPPLTPPVGRPLACRRRRRACAVPVPRSCPRLSDAPHKAPGRRTGAHAPFGRPAACRMDLPVGFAGRGGLGHDRHRLPPHACPSALPCCPHWATRSDDPVARVRLRPAAPGCARAARLPGGRPACGSQKNQRSAEAGSAASAGRRGRADPVCARKACRRVPAPGRGRPRPGRRPRRVTRRDPRLSLSGRTPPARGRRARRSPCCTRGRSPVLRRVRPC